MKKPSLDSARAFRVTILPSNSELYGTRIEETFAGDHHTLATHVVSASPRQTHRVIDAVLMAVKESGHSISILHHTQREPIRILESVGVRLSLILLATLPVSKHEKVRSLVAGVNSMSTEETYYWYAKCLGPDAALARKALRMLLAGGKS